MSDIAVPQLPPPAARQRLWSLFGAIVRRWSDIEPDTLRSNWLVFIGNRIAVDAQYAATYREAAELLDGWVAQMGEAAAYEKLLTDADANKAPPTTPAARARQLVSNEFIVLFLSLGGFKPYGAVNYLGYIAGANIAGHTPYRAARQAGGEGAA